MTISSCVGTVSDILAGSYHPTHTLKNQKKHARTSSVKESCVHTMPKHRPILLEFATPNTDLAFRAAHILSKHETRDDGPDSDRFRGGGVEEKLHGICRGSGLGACGALVLGLGLDTAIVGSLVHLSQRF